MDRNGKLIALNQSPNQNQFKVLANVSELTILSMEAPEEIWASKMSLSSGSAGGCGVSTAGSPPLPGSFLPLSLPLSLPGINPTN